MRLVDADNARECFGGDGVTGAFMRRMFDSLPTIDAVPVVRCRECGHYDHGCCVVKRYEGDDNIIAMPPDGYCSYGQRKETDLDEAIEKYLKIKEGGQHGQA